LSVLANIYNIMKVTIPFRLLLLIISSATRTNCTLISTVGSVYEVFSPKSMVRFFEFNDVGWNITSDCIRDMYTYLDGLQKDAKWAYKCKCCWIRLSDSRVCVC